LLDRRLQSSRLQRQSCQAHSPAHTPVKQAREHRLKISLPIRAMRQSFLRVSLNVIAVADRETEKAADPLLVAKSSAHPFQQTVQPSKEEVIVHFIGIEREGPFDHRLCGRRADR
jgi:hypothetical protein